MKDKFNYIVIDSLFILFVSDFCVLVKMLDCIIVVVKVEEMKIGIVKEMIKRLKSVNVNLIGVVFI